MDNIKIQIKLPDGELLSVEPITYFEVINIGKKYLFYTKNEIVENNLVKLYAAEVVETAENLSVGEKMSDEEWTNLKNIMKSILTDSTDENIRYLEIEVS